MVPLGYKTISHYIKPDPCRGAYVGSAQFSSGSHCTPKATKLSEGSNPVVPEDGLNRCMYTRPVMTNEW
jgi:hypothetical protein